MSMHAAAIQMVLASLSEEAESLPSVPVHKALPILTRITFSKTITNSTIFSARWKMAIKFRQRCYLSLEPSKRS